LQEQQNSEKELHPGYSTGPIELRNYTAHAMWPTYLPHFRMCLLCYSGPFWKAFNLV